MRRHGRRMDFQPGQQVGGLSIERRLGSGAYGVVYLARDTLLGRRVALKVLPGGEREVPEEVRERTLTEARLISNLNSPHIVTLYRLHSADGGWMQEMELVEGGSLDDLLEEGKPLPLEKAVHVFRGLCLALKTAHAARIIHGDIKPANVLFGADDLVKLADFGLARMLEGTGVEVALEGQVFGSPRYMAPEVISGQSAGMASDIWSATVLFYRLLSGRFPFQAEVFPVLFHAILYKEPEPLGPEVPRPLAALISRCLVKRVEERLSSAAAIVDELDLVASRDTRLAPLPAAPERPTNYVPPTTSFIGREEEIAQLAGLLAEEKTRLVTLTGPGGIGKTRLSQELCGRLLDRFEGGCWFVDLSRTHDTDGIAHEVAEALGVPYSGEKEAAQFVTGVLQYRKPMLVVLDNFEQILEGATGTVGLWLKRVPQVRFLVTSRALLGLAGECQYDLHPLPTPTERDEADPGAFAGVRLFVERAREANPGFALDDSNAGDVVRICRELDGMPLAIELAAARARIMRAEQIAHKLGRKFELLRSTRRDLTPRQRTLQGAIEWSYDLLEDWEREAYLQACYFRDGLTLDAAEEVIDLSAFEDAPLAMDVAQSLREKSLFTAHDTGFETRLGMYRAIREFGQRKWRETADDERQRLLARRHADHYLAFAEEWTRRIPGPREPEALDRIGDEIGNLMCAEEWALEAGDIGTAVRAALAAAETMKIRRPPRQLLQVIEPVLHALQDEPSEQEVRLKSYQVAAHRQSGDWDSAMREADEVVAGARAVAGDGTLAHALVERGEMLRGRGRLQEALESLREGEEIARRTGDRHALALGVGYRGHVLWQQGDTDGAFDCFREAEQIAREIGDQVTAALQVGNQGVVYESRGDLPAAGACHREAEEINRRIGNRLGVAVSLGNRANVLAQTDLDAALRCSREAEAIARELGARQRIGYIVGNRGALHAMRGELDEALACYAEAEAIARELGDRRRLAVTLGQRARALSRRGQADDALECYEEAEKIAREIGDREAVARNLCDRGNLYRQTGRIEEAWRTLGEGIRLYDEMHANRSVWYFSFKANLAGIAKARGDVETAARLAREGLELAGQLGLTDQNPEASTREGLATLRSLLG